VSCRQPLHITSSGRGIDKTDSGANAEPKSFQINSWFRKKGSIELGLDTNAAIVSPDSTYTVGITGRNISSVPVEKLSVRLIETVRWGGNKSYELQSHRIIAESTIPVDKLSTFWQAQSKSNAKKIGGSRATIVPDESPSTDKAGRIITQLHLKKNARDSYQGRMINVHHSLQVAAVTNGKNLTNPEINTLMEVCRQ